MPVAWAETQRAQALQVTERLRSTLHYTESTSTNARTDGGYLQLQL